VLNFVKIRQSFVEILQFLKIFKMAAAAILDFRNSQILLADGSAEPRCITVPYSIKIHQSIAELL